MTPAAPHVCQFCMYSFVNKNGHGCLECGLWQRVVSVDNTCSRWQAGYAAKKFEADAIRAEREERARRKAEQPVQLDIFEDTND